MNRITTSTEYWLEIWMKNGNHKQVSKIMGQKMPKEPRSILRFLETRQPDEPQWFEINSFLDILDDKYEMLEAQGVSREDLSIWMNCRYEEDECRVSLDPVTLMRLGEEQVKLCITCSPDGGPAPVMEAKENFVKRLVEIQEICIEDETADGISPRAEGTEVTVGFDDGTAWTASFISFRHLQVLLASARKNGEFRNGSYFWLPNMVIVGALTREEIERTTINLLQLGKFEQAFAPLEEVCEKEEEQITAELSVIHEAGIELNIEDLLSINEPYIISSQNFWAVRKIQTPEQPAPDFLTYFLDMLEGKYSALAEIGIQRKDIAINWSYRYEGQCNLEFAPDVLERMGRNGISLNIFLAQIANGIVREI